MNIFLYSVQNVFNEWRAIKFNASNYLLSVGPYVTLWLINLIDVIYFFDIPLIWTMIIDSH